jgi:diguanylate cyclase (GGDEF)-like protein/PAS domain S-box-containing protein
LAAHIGTGAVLEDKTSQMTTSTPAEGLFRTLFDAAPQASLVLSEAGRVVLANARAEQLLGYPRSELTGRPFEDFVLSGWRSFWFDAKGWPAADGEEEILDAHARRQDGSELPVTLTLNRLRIEGQDFLSVGVNDVSARNRDAGSRTQEASHDPLTGLPNRTLFLDRLDHAVRRARRSKHPLAVLFLDLDDFKLVNDTRGHDIGDLLLVALTPKLASALRPGDTIARFGGDEFVVLCEELTGEADAIGIATRIAQACSTPVTIGGIEHTVTVSAGVALVGDPVTASPVGLLRDADAAMYRAKARGKGRVAMFDEGMRARLVERMAIENSLRKALDRDELRVFYQPVMSLRHNRIVSVEALLRWQHPDRGLLEPAAFIAVAESSGLIVRIGEWVMEQACRQGAAWQAAAPDPEPVRVSVNLSTQQLVRSDVASSVARTLALTGLDPGLLDLEITEAMLLRDVDSSANALHALKRLGVRLVLDDFGTGYSSLSYLKRLTIDGLKIDRSFVEALSDEGEDGAIIGAVLSMANVLDIGVTAEGVETGAQLSRLRQHGCDSVQGFLFSRPAPAEEIETLFGSGRLGELMAA